MQPYSSGLDGPDQNEPWQCGWCEGMGLTTIVSLPRDQVSPALPRIDLFCEACEGRLRDVGTMRHVTGYRGSPFHRLAADPEQRAPRPGDERPAAPNTGADRTRLGRVPEKEAGDEC